MYDMCDIYICLPGLVQKNAINCQHPKGSISPPVAARWSKQMKRGDVFGNQGARVTQGPQIALLAMKTVRFQTIKHSRFKQHKNLQNNK